MGKFRKLMSEGEFWARLSQHSSWTSEAQVDSNPLRGSQEMSRGSDVTRRKALEESLVDSQRQLVISSHPPRAAAYDALFGMHY